MLLFTWSSKGSGVHLESHASEPRACNWFLTMDRRFCHAEVSVTCYRKSVSATLSRLAFGGTDT